MLEPNVWDPKNDDKKYSTKFSKMVASSKHRKRRAGHHSKDK